MSVVRVDNHSVSLDGFGSGAGKTREEPFDLTAAEWANSAEGGPMNPAPLPGPHGGPRSEETQCPT